MKIISKPKTGTLKALAGFVLLLFCLTLWAAYDARSAREIAWIHLGTLVFLPAVILVLVIRTAAFYKIVTLEKNRLIVKYWYSSRRQIFKLPDHLVGWEETKIRTNGQDFLHLALTFRSAKKLTFSNKEHTAYEQIAGEMKKRYGKFRNKLKT